MKPDDLQTLYLRLPLEGRQAIDRTCDRFEAAWSQDKAPDIASFLGDSLLPERFALLCELVILDLGNRWRRRDAISWGTHQAREPNSCLPAQPILDDYLCQYPELGKLQDLPLALIKEEYRVRCLANDPPGRDEYEARFPHRIDWAELQAHGPGHDTTPVVGQSVDTRSRLDWIRCPSCSTRVETAGVDTVTEFVCGDCGERFKVAEDTPHQSLDRRRIAHFELLSEVGKGGFGSVWKARDTHLDRLVAVKIPSAGTRATHSKQFIREARAAARLRHPGIVSVHDVGRDGAVVYIVSDLIDGNDLGQHLENHSLPIGDAVRISIKIAEALAYAHDAGVIHRDLKPQNVLIDGIGEPHITDFGLAKYDTSEVTMTLDGQILGTPAYMSPEQAKGESHLADCRSDIYSMGVILFQLLTGELPFRGRVRVLMEQIIHDEPPRPGKFNSVVPRDLETLCLKCLQKEPARRYQSARELADELTRFSRGEPIVARPIARTERLARWCRRKPLVASLTAATGLLLLLVTVAIGIGYVREARQRSIAEQNFELARSAVDEFLTKVANDPRMKSRGAERLRRSLLESASLFYRDFVTKDPNNPRLQLQHARAFHQLGLIARTLALHEEAESDFGQAIVIFEQLVKRQPANRTYRSELAMSRHDLALVWQDIGKDAQTRDNFGRAIVTFRELVATDQDDVDAMYHLATALNNVAILEKKAGNWSEAEAIHHDVIATAERLVAREPQSTRFLNALAMLRYNLGTTLLQTGRVELAVGEYEAALEVRRQLAERDPSVEHLTNLAVSQSAAGTLFARTGSLDDARTAYESANEIRRQLAREHPDVPEFESDLARTLSALAAYFSEIGQWQLALEKNREALALYQELVERYPQFADYRVSQALIHNDVGTIFRSQSKLADAEREFRASLDTLGPLGASDAVHERNVRVDAHYGLAVVFQLSGRAELAKKEYQHVIPIAERLTMREPDVPEYWASLSACCNGLGVLLKDERDFAAAERALVQARDVLIQLSTSVPEVTKHQETLIGTLYNLGNVYSLGARTEDAVRAFVSAAELQNDLAKKQPGNLAYLHGRAMSHVYLGSLYAKFDDVTNAETEFTTAIDLFNALIVEHPTVVQFRSDLATNHSQLANLYEKTDRPNDSQRSAQLATETLQDLHDLHPDPVFLLRKAQSLQQIGRIASGQSRFEDALVSFDECMAAVERLLAADSNHGQARSLLDRVQMERATVVVRVGRVAEAVAEVDRVLDNRQPADGTLLYNAGCVLAQASRAVGSDASLAIDERDSMVARYAAAAFEYLNAALAAGFFENRDNVQLLKGDPDFAPLRDRPGYQELLNKVDSTRGTP